MIIAQGCTRGDVVWGSHDDCIQREVVGEEHQQRRRKGRFGKGD